jgi:Na+-driven multidrug efflux pump
VASKLTRAMIPLVFGVSTATLTVVGVNMGAGQSARARQIGWVSGTVGLFLTGTIGLAVALFPTIWLHLFSHDAEGVKARSIFISSRRPMPRWASAL